MSLAKSVRAAKALLKAASPNVAVVSSGGKNVYSSSPKATGIPTKFSMGSTGSGKKISSMSGSHAGSEGFSSKDHMDAYRAHKNHVSQLDPKDTHPDLIAHHQSAMNHHWKAASADPVKKAHHGHHTLIGHTRHGHEIHRHKHAGHADHKEWSKEDHHDAAHAHHRRVDRVMKHLHHSSKHKKHKVTALLQTVLDQHGERAYEHHAKSRGE